MKVLYVVPYSLARDHSGCQIASLETVRSIQALCELHLLLPQPRSDEEKDLSLLFEAAPGAAVHFYRRRAPKWARAARYGLGAASALAGRSYVAGTWADGGPGGLCDRVRQLAVGRRFDVVHCEYLTTAVAIAGLPLPTLIRTVDVHFVGLQESLANGPVGGALQRWFWRSEIGRLRRFEIGFLRAAKAPVTISVDDEHLLRRNGVEHIRTIPPPMPLPPAPAIDRTPGGARHVLFVGRLDLSVNRQALFAFVDEIWPRVDPGCRDRVRVVFAGGVPDREVFQRAGKAGISVRPSPSSAELKSLFNRADVILGPVTTGTGIKIKTLEAMAYGKAVVGFPNAFRGIPAKHDRHALIARSAGEFVELFELAISDHVLRRRLGEAARSLVGTSFNPSKLGARLIEAYANVQVDRATRVRRESRGRRCVAERNTHEQIA